MNQPAKNIVELRNSDAVTPMMKQYLSIKNSHSDYLLFYRMGDFYELFFDDAVVAAAALDIALTKRGKHEGLDIPMCGVPAHSSDQYLYKLIEKGFKVAICEQMEDPAEAKKRGYKAVVRREVTRIITPGTLSEDSLLEATSSNYLAAINQNKNEISVSWVDMSTGDFFVSSSAANLLSSELSRISPKEILVSDRLLSSPAISVILHDWEGKITPHTSSLFDGSKGERKLRKFYGVSSLESFGEFNKNEAGCCGAIIEYLELTQKGSLPHLKNPKKSVVSDFMMIDSATRGNLELTKTISGEYRGSLLSVINKTASSPGARLLNNYLGSPLTDKSSIEKRLDAVEFFINNSELKKGLRNALKHTPDMERALSRLYMKRAGPNDIAAIRDGLIRVMEILEILELRNKKETPKSITECIKNLGNHDVLLIELKNALKREVGYQLREGGFIREGYHPKLDEYRNARRDGEKLKEKLRIKYAKESSIDKLKIKENNVLGHFIEVTSQNSSKVPDYFTHRQTLAGVVRYTTQELRELEHKIINASGYAIELEIEIFYSLVAKIMEHSDKILLSAHYLAVLDIFSAFSELATERRYNRPEISNGNEFTIKGGRHPVVEITAEDGFISNDCDLSGSQRLWVVTGPNMAGKSTFLRQNALITILAQIGSFVPAKSAVIGLTDRIFSRVGAADDLARGRSTFMVEMVETATILNNATEKSLVILDEIGRGTSTFDGLSIAWAVIEHLHDKNKCRSLFATHYHELTELSERLDSMACYAMKVKEWEGDVIFLHEVVPGVADKSYGIHVGKLAGLPRIVTKRANDILKKLQQGKNSHRISRLIDDLPLFSQFEEDEVKYEPEAIKMLKDIDMEDITPREALEILYNLKEKLN